MWVTNLHIVTPNNRRFANLRLEKKKNNNNNNNNNLKRMKKEEEESCRCSMKKRNEFEGKAWVRNIKTSRPKLKIPVTIKINLVGWFFHLSTQKGAIEERSWIRLVTCFPKRGRREKKNQQQQQQRERDVTKSQFLFPLGGNGGNVGCWFVKVSLYLSSVILFSITLAPSCTEHGCITASSFLLASNGDKHCCPNRNSGLSRQYCISQRVSPSWKVRVGVNLAKLSMFAGYLVLLAGDVSSNPGPSTQLESKASKCAFCSKILRKKQPRMACKSCKRFFHLSCLDDGFEVTRFCHQCLENDSGAEETSESDEPFIPLKLREVVKLRGLKIVHQNT